MYQLYYYPNNASLAPHFLLYHMGLDYTLLLVDKKCNSQKSTEYLALNPAGRIPTLVDDGQAIFESAAICIHLCEQHPEFNLIPKLGTMERPMFFQWLMYLTNTLQAQLMVRHYPNQHTNDPINITNIVAAQDNLISATFTIINEQLSDKPYLLGDQISACDFYLFMLVCWSIKITPSPLEYRYLATYLKRMSQHQTIKEVCAIENINLDSFL